MVWESIFTGIVSGLAVEKLSALGVRFKGDPKPFREKPHWRLGDWPKVGREVVGRDEMTEDLSRRLTESRNVAIVHGTGGVGKTTLARHFVDIHGADYDGVLWAQAEDETTLINDLTLLAAAMKVPGLEDMAEAGHRARACLTAVAAGKANWLIVLDNAEHEKAVSKWVETSPRVRVLVTSRSIHWSPAYRRVPAGTLPTETVGDPGPVLLMREAETWDDPEAARALAEDLGGLPLALVAAGGLIRDTGGGFAAYRDRLGAILSEVPAGDYPDSVIGAVTLSYDALDDDARAVLDLFAWFAPEGLDAALLTDVPTAPQLDAVKGDIGDALLAPCADADRVEKALTVLVRRSLLVREGETFSLHRMSAAALRALQAQAGRRDDAARQAAAVLAAAYPFDSDFSEHWPACARLTPHVLALFRAWPLAEAERLESAAADYLFNQASIFLREMAEVGPALALAEAALDLKRARLPESDRVIAVGWSMLGDAYRQAGRLEEAVAAQAENVRLCEAHDHGAADTATVHNNHAAALRALGQARGERALLAQARAADERALALRREAFGEQSAEVANSLANLAVDHQALGEIAAALDLSHQALAIWRKVLPPGDARLGFALNNTGSFHLWPGQAGAALPLLAEALELRRAAYGRDNHPEVTNTASWLVICHLVLARRDPAQEAEAKRVAQAFKLDWDEAQRLAAQYPGPVD